MPDDGTPESNYEPEPHPDIPPVPPPPSVPASPAPVVHRPFRVAPPRPPEIVAQPFQPAALRVTVSDKNSHLPPPANVPSVPPAPPAPITNQALAQNSAGTLGSIQQLPAAADSVMPLVADASLPARADVRFAVSTSSNNSADEWCSRECTANAWRKFRQRAFTDCSTNRAIVTPATQRETKAAHDLQHATKTARRKTVVSQTLTCNSFIHIAFCGFTTPSAKRQAIKFTVKTPTIEFSLHDRFAANERRFTSTPGFSNQLRARLVQHRARCRFFLWRFLFVDRDDRIPARGL